MNAETTVTADGRQVVLIHFLLDNKIVCMPNLLTKDMSASTIRITPIMRTDSAAGVTCAMCKRTKEWVEAKK